MHNFIDKVDWKETEKKDYVLYFGRFSEEKGIGTLIKVCKELPDVQFIFAGTGTLEETVNGIPYKGRHCPSRGAVLPSSFVQKGCL